MLGYAVLTGGAAWAVEVMRNEIATASMANRATIHGRLTLPSNLLIRVKFRNRV
jgi:hypothetical protein